MSFNIKSKIIASLENSELQLVEFPEAKLDSEELQNEYNKDVAVGEELSEEIQSLEDANEQLINLDDNIAQQAVNIQAMEGGSEEGSAEPAPEGEAPAQTPEEDGSQPEEGQAEGEGEVPSEPEPTLDESSSDEEVGQEVMEEQAALESFSRDLSGYGRKQLLGSFGMESIGYRNILANPRDAYKETHRQFLKVRSAAMEAIRMTESNILSRIVNWVSGENALWLKYGRETKEMADEIKQYKSSKTSTNTVDLSARVMVLSSDLPRVCFNNFSKFYSMNQAKGTLDRFPKLPTGLKLEGYKESELFPIGIEEFTADSAIVLCLVDGKQSEGKDDVVTARVYIDKPVRLNNGAQASDLMSKIVKNMVGSRETVDPILSTVESAYKRVGGMGLIEAFLKWSLAPLGVGHEIAQALDEELKDIGKGWRAVIGYLVGGTVTSNVQAFKTFVKHSLSGLVNTNVALPAVFLGVKTAVYLSRGRYFGRASKGNILYYHYYHANKELLQAFK